MLGFIGNIGAWEIALILVIALIVVGPGKLPEVAKSVGKAFNEFKKTTSGVKREVEDAFKFDDDEPVRKPRAIKSVVKEDEDEENIGQIDKEAEKDEVK